MCEPNTPNLALPVLKLDKLSHTHLAVRLRLKQVKNQTEPLQIQLQHLQSYLQNPTAVANCSCPLNFFFMVKVCIHLFFTQSFLTQDAIFSCPTTQVFDSIHLFSKGPSIIFTTSPQAQKPLSQGTQALRPTLQIILI